MLGIPCIPFQITGRYRYRYTTFLRPFLTAAASSSATTASGSLSGSLIAHTSRGTLVWNAGAAALKDAVVRIEIANELKVLLEPSLLQHVPRIATDGENLASLHVVMIIEAPATGMTGDGALVHHGLTVVLAGRFQIIKLE